MCHHWTGVSTANASQTVREMPNTPTEHLNLTFK